MLACFGHGAALRRTGALRLIEGEGTTPLGDRAVKVADALAAFLLGLGAPLDPLSSGRLRRQAVPAKSPGREESIAEISAFLAAAHPPAARRRRARTPPRSWRAPPTGRCCSPTCASSPSPR